MLVASEKAEDWGLFVPPGRTTVERAGAEVEVEFVNIALADFV